MSTISKHLPIGTIYDIPVSRSFPTAWTSKSFDDQGDELANFVTPHRRDFYMMLFIGGGINHFRIGRNVYQMEKPVMLFLHPNDVFSISASPITVSTFYLFFKKPFIANHPQLKAIVERYELFHPAGNTVISLPVEEVESIHQYFEKIVAENKNHHSYHDEIVPALMQLLMIETIKIARFLKPQEKEIEHNHIHHFFELLENQVYAIDRLTPIRFKTAKEFAQFMNIHPNYLNALLKKYTGKRVSSVIRGRLLEEAKNLLLYSNWSLQDISAAIGFSDQPSFTFFFKRNCDLTPAKFRKNNWRSHSQDWAPSVTA